MPVLKVCIIQPENQGGFFVFNFFYLILYY